MRLKAPLLLALVTLAGTFAPSLAHADGFDVYGKLELGAASVRVGDSPISGGNDGTPGFGVRGNVGLAFGPGRFFGLQLTGLVLDLPGFSTANVMGGMGGGIRLNLPFDDRIGGWLDGDALVVLWGPLTNFGFSVGGGIHVKLGDDRQIRVGPFFRFLQVVDTGTLLTSSQQALMFIGGIDVEFGMPHRPDRDHDGILDADDKCPDEAGPLETQGCPDKDHDGVADVDDKCPAEADTLAVQRMKDEPGYMKLETRGCPDQDKDGVPDSLDKCPVQPGLLDGCPDKDKDGIPDNLDKCPDDPGLAAMGGCPDKDKDGIPDNLDKCPDDPGLAAMGGCPDKDKDGIPDNLDMCVDQPGPISAKGCPDKDLDGIPDSADMCVDQPGPAGAKGCPDKDADGIPDAQDKCPDQPGPADKAGCAAPVAAAPTTRIVDGKIIPLEKIEYLNDSAKFTDATTPILDELAKFLVAQPAVKLRIEDHVDDHYKPAVAMKMSQIRADQLKGYLAAHGVNVARITTKGFGATKPMVKNDTPENRAKNNRIELVVVK